MRRREPGERYSANALHVRATLAAIVVTIIGAGICALVLPDHAASILVAGGITLMLHTLTLISAALAAKFTDIQAAFSVAGYIIKLIALIAALLGVRQWLGVDVRAMFVALIFTITISLTVSTYVLATGFGPAIIEE